MAVCRRIYFIESHNAGSVRRRAYLDYCRKLRVWGDVLCFAQPWRRKRQKTTARKKADYALVQYILEYIDYLNSCGGNKNYGWKNSAELLGLLEMP